MKKKHEQGRCPICDSDNLRYRYSGIHYEGDYTCYEWECEDCHTQGTENYKMEFAEHSIIYVPTKDSIN